MKLLLSIPLPAQILLGMVLGALCGAALGPDAQSLGEIGRIVIDLIKAFAVPLVFFAVLEAILTSDIPARMVRTQLVVVVANGAAACVIGLALANYFQPGRQLREFAERSGPAVSAPADVSDKALTVVGVVASHIPRHLLQPFTESNVLMVVLLAVLLGIAARREIAHTDHPLKRGVTFAVKLCERLLSWLVQLVPLAVLGACAKTVGQHGLKPFEALVTYVGVCLLGLALQCIVVYHSWIIFVAKISLSTFWGAATKPVIYAFGTNSSLATLPLTLSSLDSLGVKKASSRLGACVGTNFNNDGIVLYEAMAVLFVAQAVGIDLSLIEQLGIAGLCVLTAIGVAGVPEAGIISLALVLTASKMPTDLLPVFLTVDWIVARARSVTNVLSDMTVSIALDKLSDSRSC